jgi:outer membrane lipoprotein SlyB
MVSTIVGGIVGSAVGASTEEQLTKTTAYEFLIKDRYGEILSIVQTNEENLKVGEKVLIMDSGKSRIVRLIEE